MGGVHATSSGSAQACGRMHRVLRPASREPRVSSLRAWWDFGRLSAGDLLQPASGRVASAQSLDTHLHAALKWLCLAQDVSGTAASPMDTALEGDGANPTGRRPATSFPPSCAPPPDCSARTSRYARCGPQTGCCPCRIATVRSAIRTMAAQASFSTLARYCSDTFLPTGIPAKRDILRPRAAPGTGSSTLPIQKDSGRATNISIRPMCTTPGPHGRCCALMQSQNNAQYSRVARANLDWALSNQQASGLFDNAAFHKGDNPYTHNISYSICGLQESGWLLGEARYCEAARKAADACLALMRSSGSIPGQISPDAKSLARYTCLTGNCQLAVVWSRLFGKHGNQAYQAAARKSLGFVMQHQQLEDAPSSVAGAVAGSFPIWGRYAPLSFPNWAAKFFVDAALLQRAWPGS